MGGEIFNLRQRICQIPNYYSLKEKDSSPESVILRVRGFYGFWIPSVYVLCLNISYTKPVTWMPSIEDV
jgi:hypothetical protein